MTLQIPLSNMPRMAPPACFLHEPQQPGQLERVFKTIMKARRIAVVCGAGISVGAGIPDFRSPEGLFQTLKRENPKASLNSGKDLFDASVFSSGDMTALFCQMIGQLADMAQTTSPTPFHDLLKVLDEKKKLLRVYTQNIDCLERRAGLSFGVPEFDARRGRSRTPPNTLPSPTSTPTTSVPQAQMKQTQLKMPNDEVPRCIPLHGHLEHLHCMHCRMTFDSKEHIPSLTGGSLPTCPACEDLDDVRMLEGKRSRGIGKLRPSVVLYNEVHMQGEHVGEAVRRDLVGSSKPSGRGADLLLVVGTSLKVPGTKRIVREFSRALHARNPSSQLPTPESSPGPSSPVVDETKPIRTIYLNLDFPVPSREWEGVFDAWIQGDAQTFARQLKSEMDKAEAAAAAAAQRKAEREAQAAAGVKGKGKAKATTTTATKKRKSADGTTGPAAKRSKTGKEQVQQATPLDTQFKASKPNVARQKSKHSDPSTAPSIPAGAQLPCMEYPFTFHRPVVEIPTKKPRLSEMVNIGPPPPATYDMRTKKYVHDAAIVQYPLVDQPATTGAGGRRFTRSQSRTSAVLA